MMEKMEFIRDVNEEQYGNSLGTPTDEVSNNCSRSKLCGSAKVSPRSHVFFSGAE